MIPHSNCYYFTESRNHGVPPSGLCHLFNQYLWIYFTGVLWVTVPYRIFKWNHFVNITDTPAFVKIINTYCLLHGSIYIGKVSSRQWEHSLPGWICIFHLKSCILERDPLAPDTSPKKINEAWLMIRAQWLQLFLQVGRSPKFLSQLLGLPKGPITDFQIYFYWHDLLSLKLNTTKVAPTDSSPDFHVSHVSHLNSPIRKLMSFLSPSYIHMKPVRPVSFNNASQIKILLFAFPCLHGCLGFITLPKVS